MSDMNAEKRNNPHEQNERPVLHEPFRKPRIDPADLRRIHHTTPVLDMMGEEKERARRRAAMGEGFGHADVIGFFC